MSELRGVVKDYFHTIEKMKELRETRANLKLQLDEYKDKIIDYIRSLDNGDATGFKYMGYDFILKEGFKAVKTPIDTKISRVEELLNEGYEPGSEEIIIRIIKAARMSDKEPFVKLVHKKSKKPKK